VWLASKNIIKMCKLNRMHMDGLTRFSAIFERKGDLIGGIVAQMKATCEIFNRHGSSR
jgi:hypothetical protein